MKGFKTFHFLYVESDHISFFTQIFYKFTIVLIYTNLTLHLIVIVYIAHCPTGNTPFCSFCYTFFFIDFNILCLFIFYYG